MRQNRGLTTRLTRLARVALCFGTFAAALVSIGPSVAHAADPFRPAVRDPIVPGIRSQPRAAPMPRIPSRPDPLPAPKRIAPGGIGLSPGIVRPAMPGANCRSGCGSRCQMVSC
jgi:hypothetical protein